MTSTEYARIENLIVQINKVENMIKLNSEPAENVASNLMVEQFQRLKKDFVQQLLAELIKADIKIASLEKFFVKIIPFLKRYDSKKELDKNLKTNLSKLTKTLN